ncbi:MAG: hypothetical protein L0Y77_02165 [Chlorobi bacterium]|nr:hypothetical protein [Chlorobiota bacterium]
MGTSDYYVGLIGDRIGSPTLIAPSGTVEEYYNHYNSGKQILFYFKNDLVERHSIDLDELLKIKNFQDILKKDGILFDYYYDVAELRRKLCYALYCHVIAYVNKNKIEAKEINPALYRYYFHEANNYFTLSTDSMHRFVTDYVKRTAETRKYLNVILKGSKAEGYLINVNKYVELYNFMNFDFELNNKIYSYFFSLAMENYSKSLLSVIGEEEAKILKESAVSLAKQLKTIIVDFQENSSQLDDPEKVDKILRANVFSKFKFNLNTAITIFEQNSSHLTNLISLCDKILNKKYQ